MDPDPTTARLLAGRVARRRAARAAGARVDRVDVAAPAPAAAPPHGAPAAVEPGELLRLTAPLVRQGHEVRVTDRTAPGEVPAAARKQCRLVLADVVAAMVRGAGSEQRISVRVRTDEDHLLLAVQTLPAGERPRPLVPTARDEDVVRRRVASAGGRATVRTTHGGNWIVVMRLPLHP